MDLRIRMGMTSLSEEVGNLIKLLEQREQDHKDWILELELSVKEQRKFKLATNHHECAFGKWYDSFITDNRVLHNCLKKFETPHQEIHSIANLVKKMGENNDFKSAFDIINKTKEGK